jgi:hypothetical protein
MKVILQNDIPMRFKSPKADVLEDDLVQTFGRLEPQTNVFVGI